MSKRKSKYVKVNDYKTGHLKWITKKYLPEFNRRKDVYHVKKEFKKELGRVRREPDLQRLREIYEPAMDLNTEKYKGLKKYDSILRTANDLEKNGIKPDLKELQQKIKKGNERLIIKDSGKDYFYWNIHNKIERGEFEQPKIVILDFDGSKIFESKDNVSAAEILIKKSRILENLENIIMEKEQLDPYFTVEVEDWKFQGEIIQVTIKYNRVKSRLPQDIEKKYVTDYLYK